MLREKGFWQDTCTCWDCTMWRCLAVAGGADTGSQQRVVILTRQQTTTSSSGRDGLSCSTINGHTTCNRGSSGGGVSGRDTSNNGNGGKSTSDGGSMAAGRHASTIVRSSGLSCTSHGGGRMKCSDTTGNEACLTDSMHVSFMLNTVMKYSCNVSLLLPSCMTWLAV